MALTIGDAERLVQSGNLNQGLGVLQSERRQKIDMGGTPAAGAKSGEFMDQLKDAIKQVDEMQKAADSASVDLATGHNKNVHEAMILMEKADIALKSMMAVRNKVMDAYREIMRMQV